MSEQKFERVFTEDELRRGGMRSVDVLAEAIEAGNQKAAKQAVRRFRYEIRSMYRNYAAWEESLFETIALHAGDTAASEAEDEITSGPSRLDRITLSPLDHWDQQIVEIEGRLEAGEGASAKELARALHGDALTVHDRLMTRVLALLALIVRKWGQGLVEQALAKSMGTALLGNASFKERAEALMHFGRVHLQSLVVEEDDEKVTCICSICPSGGRLLKEGHYPEGKRDAEDGFYLKGPSPLTYGRSELPVYCAHEPVMEMGSIRETGVPLFIVDPAEKLEEGPCRTYLYKNERDIPDRFYRRLGLTKPIEE